MKKTIFFLAALVLGAMAASVNAQTLSSSTVDVRYCFEDATEETVSELCNDSYLWVDASGRKETMTLTQSGDYTRTLINTRDCDSIVTLHLTLEDHRTSTEHSINLCTGEPLVFNNQTIAASPTTGTYHAYSTNAASCEHDDILNVTVTPCYPVGAASGHVFSVATDKQVYFSKGTLVYDASGTRTCNDNTQKDGTFSFAENQYTSGSLFAYGSSGYEVSPDAVYQSITNKSITGDNANHDWGVYNPITNGGNQPNQWRTLTQAEYKYLFDTRTNAKQKVGVGKVTVGDGVEGIILLPDDWTLPEGCPDFVTYETSTVRGTNTYTAEQWEEMEKAGAILFLTEPISKSDTKDHAYYYWDATTKMTKVTPTINISGGKITYTLGVSVTSRNTGTEVPRSYVRLVTDVPNEQ